MPQPTGPVTPQQSGNIPLNPTLATVLASLEEAAKKTEQNFRQLADALVIANKVYSDAVKANGVQSDEAKRTAEELNRIGKDYQDALTAATQAHNAYEKAKTTTGPEPTPNVENATAPPTPTQPVGTTSAAPTPTPTTPTPDAEPNRGEDVLLANPLAKMVELLEKLVKKNEANNTQKETPDKTPPTFTQTLGSMLGQMRGHDGVNRITNKVQGGLAGGAKLAESAGLSGLASGLGALGKAAGPVGMAVSVAAKAMFGMIDAVKGAVQAPIKALDSFIGSVESNIVRFVRFANPAKVQQWQIAVDDLWAVIGQALVPALDAARVVIRAVADGAMASLSKVISGVTSVFKTDAFLSFVKRIASTVSGVVASFGPLLAGVGRALQPVFRVLEMNVAGFGELLVMVADVLGELTPILEAVANVWAEVVKALKPLASLAVQIFGGILTVFAKMASFWVSILEPIATWIIDKVGKFLEFVVRQIRAIYEFFGLTLPDYEKKAAGEPGQSVGASVRQASYSDPAADYRKAVTNALAIGTGGGDPMQKGISLLEKINSMLDGMKKGPLSQIWDKIKELLDPIVKPLEWIKKKLEEAWKWITDNLGKAWDNLKKMIEDLGKMDLTKFIKELAGEIAGHAGTFADQMLTRLRNWFNPEKWINDLVNTIKDALKDALPWNAMHNPAQNAKDALDRQGNNFKGFA